MRIEGTSSIMSVANIKPVEIDRQAVSRTEQRLQLDDRVLEQISQKNFKTFDPESGEYIAIGEKKLIEAIEQANKTLQGANTSFEFTIHEKTKEIMVKVINSETNEVIREIPPEKILDMVAKMWELAGILVDERI